MLTERHFHYLMYSHFRVSAGFQVMHTCTYRAGAGFTLVFFFLNKEMWFMGRLFYLSMFENSRL